MQIAIADATGRVNLWCEHNGMNEDGSIKFWVINGAWYGTYHDGQVYVEYTKPTFPGILVWAGKAKFNAGHYNEAIRWIQEQIDDPEYVMIPYEQIGEYNPPNYKDEKDEEDDIPF